MVDDHRTWRRLADLCQINEAGEKKAIELHPFRSLPHSLWQALDGSVYGAGTLAVAGSAQKSAILVKLDAAGILTWYKLYEGVGEFLSIGLSADESKLIVQGWPCKEGTAEDRAASCEDGTNGTIGDFTVTSTIVGKDVCGGVYLSQFVASLDPTDGSVLWAVDTPWSPSYGSISLSPDGTSAYIQIQLWLTESTTVNSRTDSQDRTTTLRSLGSYGIDSYGFGTIKLNASNGAVIWAIDGGGDGRDFSYGQGIDGNGNFIQTGYSRSHFHRYGERSMTNPQSGPTWLSDSTSFTVQFSATDELPSCVSSCTPNNPVIAPGKCLIDNYCYDDGEYSPYGSNSCHKCDVSLSQTEWTGPYTTKHCYIFGPSPDYTSPNWSRHGSDGYGTMTSSPQCHADGESKVLTFKHHWYGGNELSSCLACIVAESTSDWSVRDNYDYADGTCIKLETIMVGPTTSPSGIMTSLGTAMTASTKVTEIVAAIADLDAAKSLYVGSTLQTLARTSWAGTSDFDAAAAYFGSATWLDDYLLAAFDGTGQFSGGTQERRELSGDDNHTSGRDDMINARTEAVRAALQNQIVVMACLSSVASNTTSDANWDLAYAYWHGDTPSAAPYAYADERCKSYGTCSTGDGITARANFAVLKAIAEGKQAAVDGDAAAASAAFTAMRGAALGVYYQAALRSAFQMDDALNQDPPSKTTGYQGEGNSVWRVIAPILNAAEYVTDFFKMTNTPSTLNSRYCPLKFLLDQNLVAGFNSTALATLENTTDILCIQGVQAVPPPPPSMPPPSSLPDASTTVIAAVGVSAGIAMLLIALLVCWWRSSAERLGVGPLAKPPSCDWKLSEGRTYLAFLSHYKVESGSDARYLHDLLQRMVRRGKMYLDSNDLSDLSTLFTEGIHKSEVPPPLLSHRVAMPCPHLPSCSHRHPRRTLLPLGDHPHCHQKCPDATMVPPRAIRGSCAQAASSAPPRRERRLQPRARPAPHREYRDRTRAAEPGRARDDRGAPHDDRLDAFQVQARPALLSGGRRRHAATVAPVGIG